MGRLPKIFIFFCLFLNSSNAQRAQEKSSIWLLQPPSRLLERAENGQRLPEAMCPTPRSQNDNATELFAGEPFPVLWRNPSQIHPSELRIELLGRGLNNILAKLETFGEELYDIANGTTSARVLIPHQIQCRECVIRLTIGSVTDQSQIISCADVQVLKPSTQPSTRIVALKPKAPEASESIVECLNNEDCGFGEGNECFQGFCFCQPGKFGRKCANESNLDVANVLADTSQGAFRSVQFPMSNNELRWRINPKENVVEMALRLNEKIMGVENLKWIVLGVQATEADSMCRKIIEEKNGIKPSEHRINASKAFGAPPLRPESSENAIKEADSSDSSHGLLKIQKLNNNTDSERQIAKGADGQCGQNARFEACPEITRQCEPSCDWIAFPDSIPSCPPRAHDSCGEPRCVCQEGFVRLAADQDECKPFNFCQAAEVIQECPKNETWAKCGAACEPTCETMYSPDPCRSSCERPGCTCADNHVRNGHGQCIYWGNCPNIEERFPSSGEEEQRSTGVRISGETEESEKKGTAAVISITSTLATTVRKTTEAIKAEVTAAEAVGLPVEDPNRAPVPTAEDRQCPINETFNECGRVCEADCVSIFEREECRECGPPSCACQQGYARNRGVCMYWGDCPFNHALSTVNGKESASSTPAAQASNSSDQKASAKNESMNCSGQWAWPQDCRDDKCTYRLMWAYDAASDVMDFSLEARRPKQLKSSGGGWWSGVGFSASGKIQDVFVVKSPQDAGGVGPVSIVDMHFVEHGGNQLREDEHNDIMIKAGDRVMGQTGGNVDPEGLMMAKFSRKRKTGDREDHDMAISADKCFKFVFFTSGGQLDANGTVLFPDQPPHISDEVCIGACKPEAAKKVEFSCDSEFRWPLGCQPDEACDYRANWAYNAQLQEVQFNVSSKGIGRWTGIGLSRDGQMANSDIYTGWVYDRRAYVTDRFAYGHQSPAIDPTDRQDIYGVFGRMEDDVQTISFRRKLVTRDTQTDFPLDQCYHFLFPVGGGRVLARNNRDFQNSRTPIGYHDQHPPQFSAQKICICDAEGRPVPSQKAKKQRQHSIAKRQVVRSDSFGEAARSIDTVSAPPSAPAPEGGPYACADVTIVEVLMTGSNERIRVVDAFGLSSASLMADESWGGRQSLDEIATTRDANGTMIILIKRPLRDPQNSHADLTIRTDSGTPMFLAQGSGNVDLAAAKIVEFANVEMMSPIAEATETRPSSSKLPEETTTTTQESTTSTTSISTQKITTTTTEESEVVKEEGTAKDGKIPANSVIPSSKSEEMKPASGNVPSESKQPEQSAPATNPPANVVQPENPAEAGEVAESSSLQPFAAGPGFEGLPLDLESTDPMAAEMPDENCFGGFAWPERCLAAQTGDANSVDFSACSYMVEWQVNAKDRAVNFHIIANARPNTWTGIGFSADGSMANADAVIVSMHGDGMMEVTDQFSPGYGRPRVDQMQDVFNVESGLSDGRLSVNFSRSLTTGDMVDDLDLGVQCTHFLFLHSGGPLDTNGEVRKHTATPTASRNKICLGKCNLSVSVPPTPQVTTTSQISEKPSILTTVQPPSPSTATTASPIPDTTTTSATTTSATSESTTPSTSTSKKIPESTTTSKARTTTVSPIVRSKATSASSKATTTSGPATLPPQKKPKEKKVQVAGVDANDVDTVLPRREMVFDVLLRLVDEDWNEELANTNSTAFAKMVTRLRGIMFPLVASKWSALKELKVLNFVQGSVKALLQMQFDGEDIPTDAEELKEFLQEIANKGLANELKIDAEMLHVQDRGIDANDKWSPFRELQNWAIVLGALIILVTTVALMLFLTFRSRKGRNNFSKQAMPFGMQHPSYHQYAVYPMGMNNGAFDTNGKDTQTTKTTMLNGGGGGGKRGSENQANGGRGSPASSAVETPRGIGEATYKEWFSKVASKDTNSHLQESMSYGSAATTVTRPPLPTPMHSSYVTYPNDPGVYYTLGGDHRIPAPPSYYRQY